jgi:hypothetical protein
MLRETDRRPSWWNRLFVQAKVPAYIPMRPAVLRRCPECATSYELRDHYCPSCHAAVPEWRWG